MFYETEPGVRNDLAAIKKKKKKKGTVQKVLLSTESTQIHQRSYSWYSYEVGDDILLLQIIIENHMFLLHNRIKLLVTIKYPLRLLINHLKHSYLIYILSYNIISDLLMLKKRLLTFIDSNLSLQTTEPEVSGRKLLTFT